MKNNLTTGVIVVLLVASLGANYYLWDQNTKVNKQFETLKKNPQKIAQEEAKTLTQKLEKLISLPKGEEPTVATIADITKIDKAKQPFFKNAKNGDKVVIYPKARKVYLYRESENKLVEVGTLNIQQQGESTPAPTERP